jgi:starch synthase
MKIVLATSEAIPYAKTGGLADVAGTLPRALADLGHEVTLVMPAYRSALRAGVAVEDTGIDLPIQIASKTVNARLLKSQLPGSNVTVYLVEQDAYFDRAELYSTDGADYKDNCERFVFFSRAVMEMIARLELKPDVLHANDWQTALLPVYLNVEYRHRPGFENTVSLLTIHNMAYQGCFWHWDMELTGLDWKYFNWQYLEFYGEVNLLKGGIAMADSINTVSRRYAEEIQTSPDGCGLESLLQHRSAHLSGIINGVDYSDWNPKSDTHIAANYDADNFAAGKEACRADLRREFGLPDQGNMPILGFVGRLAEQKGVDLIVDVMQKYAEQWQVQWAFLGTGDPKYHELLSDLAQRYPDRVAVKLAFSNALAHQIEAGADMFLMPSRYEPCGLNQMYSLKYGTPPIVRSTGGLADTITDTNEASLADGTANGFAFERYHTDALADAIERAVATYGTPEVWNQVVQNGMRQDWSWTRSAHDYVTLYEQTAERVHGSLALK